MIRVMIVEEMTLLRGGLVALLEGEPDISVVAAVDCANKIVPVGLEFTPDVALIDIELPDVDGFEAARTARAKLDDCAVVLMTDRCRPGDLRRTMDAEAAGIVLKDTSPDGLATAIRRVARGERVIDADVALAELDAARTPLTERELEVLRLAAEGATAEQIARTLVLTIGTVRNHLSRINRKTGARNRVHAIRIAESAGWL